MARTNVEECVARAVRAELLRIVMAPGSEPDDVLEAERRLSTQATDPAALADELVARTNGRPDQMVIGQAVLDLFRYFDHNEASLEWCRKWHALMGDHHAKPPGR